MDINCQLTMWNDTLSAYRVLYLFILYVFMSLLFPLFVEENFITVPVFVPIVTNSHINAEKYL